MKDTARCCDYGCDGSPGCLGGHDQLVWPVLDPLYTTRATITMNDDDDPTTPWAELDLTTSIVIWIVVVMCTLIVSYIGFTAWSWIIWAFS